MEFIDYYKVLKISENASLSDIKVAFRELAKKYHPDRNKSKDANLKFREIFEAYEILKNSLTRDIFDKQRQNYYRNSKNGITTEEYERKENYQSAKEQANKRAKYFSRMTFDDFLNSSIFMIKKTTSTFALLLMLLFGLFMIIFGFYLLTQSNDNEEIGFFGMLFSIAFGATMIYIAQKDLQQKNS